ncbi:MAG: glycosyltransferase [Myxococcota bacterium]
MIKVVHSISRLAGGPAYRTVLLAEHMQKMGYENILIHGSLDKWDPRNFEKKDFNFATIHLPAMKRNIYPLKDTATIYHFVKLFRRLKPDIVHTHQSKDGFLARLAAKITGIPVIIRTYHGLVYYNNYFGLKTRLVQPLFLNLERACNLFTDQIIAISKIQSREIATDFKLTVPDKITVVPNSFILEPFLDSTRSNILHEQFNLNPEAVILTCVANFQPPKDHQNILKAFNLFRARNSEMDPHLVLVGSGPLQPEVENWIQEMELSDSVHLTGYRTDIPEIYAASDLAFLGSKSEGTPGSLIEALAAGIKVVSTEVGGIRDVLNDGNWGTLCSPRNYRALAGAMEKEFSLERDHSRIQQKVQKKYGVANVAKLMDKLYQHLLAEKSQ